MRLGGGCGSGPLCTVGGGLAVTFHGWGWFLFAFAGSIAGVRLRVAIGMNPPRPRAADVAARAT